MDLATLKAKLQEAGVVCEHGLTEGEIQLVQRSFGFQFPPDLKSFLMYVLPSGKGWPNWRDVNDPEIERMLNWPYEGICFDFQNNSFWPTDWGTKPASLSDAFEIAKGKVDAAPKLIPILGHRYLPARPLLEGNPVFSVYQTDIIYYGSNLWEYFQNEFHYYFGVAEYQITAPPRRIEFWSDFVDDAY
ncbi:MAG TPA: hypothetical protein VGD38_07350 [Pyrinomonadaceae bacterium]